MKNINVLQETHASIMIPDTSLAETVNCLIRGWAIIQEGDIISVNAGSLGGANLTKEAFTPKTA